MGKPAIDMVGKQCNRWTVLREVAKPEGRKQTGKFFECVCACGSVNVVYGTSLRNGTSKSCGCHKAEVNASKMRAMRLKQHGTIEERFFSRFVKLDNGCWQWKSHADKDGYGILPGDGKNIRAHRFSYEYHFGKIPQGLVICHKCDNPGCVNPEHLFAGTVQENAQDALQKGRHYAGEKNGRSKLTNHDVLIIQKSTLSGPDLARHFGVDRSTINRIKRGESWHKSH